MTIVYPADVNTQTVHELCSELFPWKVGEIWLYDVGFTQPVLEEVTICAFEFVVSSRGVQPMVFALRGRHHQKAHIDPSKLIERVEEIAA